MLSPFSSSSRLRQGHFRLLIITATHITHTLHTLQAAGGDAKPNYLLTFAAAAELEICCRYSTADHLEDDTLYSKNALRSGQHRNSRVDLLYSKPAEARRAAQWPAKCC